MIHMKFMPKSSRFNIRQPVWHKSIISKLQKTSKGYYQTNIPKEEILQLHWPDDAILDHQVIDGKLVLTNLRSK